MTTNASRSRRNNRHSINMHDERLFELQSRPQRVQRLRHRLRFLVVRPHLCADRSGAQRLREVAERWNHQSLHQLGLCGVVGLLHTTLLGENGCRMVRRDTSHWQPCAEWTSLREDGKNKGVLKRPPLITNTHNAQLGRHFGGLHAAARDAGVCVGTV